MTTTRVSFKTHAIAMYEHATREAQREQQERHLEEAKSAQKQIARRFHEELALTVTPVLLDRDAPGADPAWFRDTSVGPWDLPWLVVIDDIAFTVFTGMRAVFICQQCPICKAYWNERCELAAAAIGEALAAGHDCAYWNERCELAAAAIGEALAAGHDCEEPGKKPSADAGGPSSRLVNGAMGAVLGGPDSDNLAVIAHNLGVIALELERFFREPRGCGAVRGELKRTGADVNTANIGRALDDFKVAGFVTEPSNGQYQDVPGMKVRILGDA